MKVNPPPAPEPNPPPPADAGGTPPTPDGVVPVPPPAAAADPNVPATWPEWFRAVDLALAILVLFPAFLVASFTARNSDLWPHLAAGRLIAQGGYSFGADPFSYATDGRYWVNHAWLADVGAYLLYAAEPTGAALVALKAVGFAVAVGLLLLIRRPGHSLWPWAVFASLAVLAAAPHTGLRPLVASAVFLAATLYVLLGREWQRASWRNPLILAGLFWLWANVDAWFVLGPLTVAVVLVGDWLHKAFLAAPGENAAGDDPFAPPAALPDLARALAVGVVACMLNPHHVRVWQLPAELGVGLPPESADPVLRFARLSPWNGFLDEAGKRRGYFDEPLLGYNLNGLAYVVLLGLGGAALVAGFARLRLSHLLLWLGFAFLSLLHHRLILLFAVAAVPIAAGCVNGLSARVRLGPKTRPGTRIALTLSGVGRVLTVAALLVMAAAAWPGWLHPRQPDPALAARVEWAVQPDPGAARAAEMIRDWRASGRLPAAFRGLILNPDLANYFAWFAPGEKVLANTRYAFHAPELAGLVAARTDIRPVGPDAGPADFSGLREACRKWDAAFVLYAEGGRPGRAIDLGPPLTMVYGTEEWRLWHIDGRAAVLGWAGRRAADPGAFDRLTFDPVRRAFDPNQPPVPEPKLTLPPPRDRAWWEEYADAPALSPVEALDAQVWVNVAKVLRDQQLQPLRHSWGWVTMGAGGGLAFAPYAFSGPPPPPPSDAAVSLQLLAVRAARRAAAANPDDPEPYLVLATAAQNRDLALPGQDARGLLLEQAVAFRQALDRLPPPDRARPQVAGAGMTVARTLARLYLTPDLAGEVTGQPTPMIDLGREAAKLAREYAEVAAAALPTAEDRKKFLDEPTRMRDQIDDEYTRRTDRYELFLKASNPKAPEQIMALVQVGLVGRAMQVFKETRVEEFGPGGFGLALMIVRLKLRAGLVAEVAQDLKDLDESLKSAPGGDSPADRGAIRQHAQVLRQVQMELWRATGDYARLREAEAAATPSARLTPEERQLVTAAVTGGRNWNALVTRLHGAVGGGFGAFLDAELTSRGFAPVPLLLWMSEAQFYLDAGVLAVLEGDMADAKRRFTQALRPQGVEIPPFRTERVVADRYLRLIAAGEAGAK